MVAALNYNEKKVNKEVASCLHAANSLKTAEEMNFYQKQQLLERHHDLSEAQTKTMHISLNFDPSEKLSKEKLVKIAEEYMEKIGFGNQPYLVYQHQDAGHPHIHIVTSLIRENGSRMPTHNIGRSKSEPARKEIEIKYGLVKAENQKQLLKEIIKPVDIQKVAYGKTETKRAITNVVNSVLKSYKFSSLHELNAILKQYNVIADKGNEASRTFRYGGLYYRVLDEQGNKSGVPIKASTINSQPTLKELEKYFERNNEDKAKLKKDVKSEIQKALAQFPLNLKELETLLKRQSIYTSIRQNADGRIYGITFVDNYRKVVFNGSDLGKAYSPKALETIFKSASQTEQDHKINPSPKPAAESIQPDIKKEEALTKNKKQGKEATADITKQSLADHNYSTTSPSVIEELIRGEKTDQYIPAELKRKRKKRKNLRM